MDNPSVAVAVTLYKGMSFEERKLFLAKISQKENNPYFGYSRDEDDHCYDIDARWEPR